MRKRKVARVFEDVGGYHYCDEGDGMLDARGAPSETKARALRLAWEAGYTHAVGSGTCWDGVRAIPVKYRKGL